MTAYRDLSIKTKLSLIAMLTCITATALASAALFLYEVRSFKRALVNDLKAQATILAGLSTAALTFDDASSSGGAWATPPRPVPCA